MILGSGIWQLRTGLHGGGGELRKLHLNLTSVGGAQLSPTPTEARQLQNSLGLAITDQVAYNDLLDAELAARRRP